MSTPVNLDKSNNDKKPSNVFLCEFKNLNFKSLNAKNIFQYI